MEIINENIKYQLDIDNKTAVVIGYPYDHFEVIIPEFIDYENENYKVTSIGKSAFYNCFSLTSITIPDSVTKIGNNVFYNCHCLQTITIPDSVTEIGDLAFYYCDNLKSITIPDSVTSIGNNAFENCQSLTSISLSNSVTKLGPFMFYRCGLESITIPDSVTSIGSYVFKHCPFKEIRIPKNCSEFYNCAFDTTMKVIIDENNPYYFNYQDFIFKFIDNENISLVRYQGNDSEVQIPELVNYKEKNYKVTEIGPEAFEDYKTLTSVNIPDSVTKIGYSAFYDCSSLTSITIPDSVKLENYVFDGCVSLQSINIPDSVTYIGYKSFFNCTNLTSITIPDSVTFIGNYALSNSPLKEVRIPKNCSEFYVRSFKETVKIIIDENNPYYFSYQDFIFKFIDNENICLFKYQGNDSEVQIPETVNYKGKDYKVIFIGVSVFYECKTLTSITIPDSVAYIGFSAFENCERLKSVNIGKRVNQISKDAFHKIGLTIPKRYTEDGRLIAYKAFNSNMTCRDFKYEEGKTYEFEGEIKCCDKGFHACISPLDIFNYYNGKFGTDIYIHEVYLSGDIDEDNDYDSKVCASKIEIGRRLTMKDINEIINNK